MTTPPRTTTNHHAHDVMPGDVILINGKTYTVEHVTSTTRLTVGPLPWWRRLAFWAWDFLWYRTPRFLGLRP